jgi:hypothetical protein
MPYLSKNALTCHDDNSFYSFHNPWKLMRIISYGSSSTTSFSYLLLSQSCFHKWIIRELHVEECLKMRNTNKQIKTSITHTLI